MDATSTPARIGDLARTCATAAGTDQLLSSALPLLRDLAGARSAFVVRRQGESQPVVAAAGDELDADVLPESLAVEAVPDLTDLEVPAAWRPDVSETAVRRLPGFADALVLAWGAAVPRHELDLALDILDAGLARTHAQEEHADLQARVDNAQQLANMGDYDWHIASDTNRWSDQLYRIYGHEPQSFNASYEKFLSHIHPDDRERITGIHQQAYGSGEPYQMIERIVRPDGEVRYLSSNGQVVMNEDRVPVRMRGTCIDITDRVLAEQARERSAARFQNLVESSPDAILVLDGEGRILQANGRAGELLGGDPVHHAINEVLPGHGAGPGRALDAIGLDGRPLRLDVTVAALSTSDEEGLVAAFLSDASPRLASEAMAASLREIQVRRRQAMEINDNVVQGLTAAVYALEHGNTGASASYLQRTLASARRMMNDLLDPLNGEDLEAGDLVRALPSTLDEGDDGASEAHSRETFTASDPGDLAGLTAAGRKRRVLIADDSPDVRMLLRIKVEAQGVGEVVGEAGDGEEAVRLATAEQPDLVLLDLAMPRMDGLEALPLIREAVDGVRVVVFSGFDEDALGQKALAAGAVRYVEKGVALSELVDIIEKVFSTAEPATA